MNRAYKILIMALMLQGVLSCAVEREESSDEVEKRELEAHVKVVHNDSLRATSSGLYIINKVKGTGKKIEDSSYVYVTYSTRDLKGNYIATTSEDIAKRVGTYSKASYYGPYLIHMTPNLLIRGLEEGLMNRYEGDEFSLIVPTWLSDYSYSGSNKSNTIPTIYDFSIRRVVKDIAKFQRDSLRSYSNLYYDGIDSTKLDWYFKIIKETGEGDSIKAGESIKYYYVGKLLNGFVFDTNIEDTARKYGIYSSSSAYEPLTYNMVAESDKESGSSSSENSVIQGMDILFKRMKYGEKAVTFFSSDYGYGGEEKEFGIYQPLFFYVEIVEKLVDK